jgi:hypothetical protein
MVESAKFERKMHAMRGLVKDRLTSSIERWADRLCKEMRLILAIQYPEVAAKVDIDWTWGDAPGCNGLCADCGRGVLPADRKILPVIGKSRAQHVRTFKQNMICNSSAEAGGKGAL